MAADACELRVKCYCRHKVTLCIQLTYRSFSKNGLDTSTRAIPSVEFKLVLAFFCAELISLRDRSEDHGMFVTNVDLLRGQSRDPAANLLRSYACDCRRGKADGETKNKRHKLR